MLALGIPLEGGSNALGTGSRASAGVFKLLVDPPEELSILDQHLAEGAQFNGKLMHCKTSDDIVSGEH